MANYSPLELEDRLYTSTEVAKILGVSLRSVYRYLEDDKLQAEMKTATGRHRFTKQNILDFLSPQPQKEKAASAEESTEDKTVPDEAGDGTEGEATEEEAEEKSDEDEKAEEDAKETDEESEEKESEETSEEDAEKKADEDAEKDKKEDVDWLEKFRAAAEKYKAEADKPKKEEKAEEVEEKAEEKVEEEPEEKSKEDPKAKEKKEDRKEDKKESESVSGLAEDAKEEEKESDDEENYYTSGVGGLKDIAQNIDKSAKKASLDYAFTRDAGLSLHKPIRPFSLIHAYVRSEDLPFFEKILDLKSTGKSDAQLCLLVSDTNSLYEKSEEIHGLKVVASSQLKKDLVTAGEDELAAEVD